MNFPVIRRRLHTQAATPLVAIDTWLKRLKGKDLRAVALNCGVSTSGRKDDIRTRLQLNFEHLLASSKNDQGIFDPKRAIPNAIVSLDLGYRNFAHVQLTKEGTITAWAVTDLGIGDPFHASTAAPCVRRYVNNELKPLLTTPDGDTVGAILLEQQRYRSAGSKNILEATVWVNTIESMLWYELQDITTQVLMQPIRRRPVDMIWEPHYRHFGLASKKRAGARLVAGWLDRNEVVSCPDHLKTMYDETSKKDDLADCLLQAMACLTQDDFRKLLQTPRAPPSSSASSTTVESKSHFKPPPAKTPRNEGAVFAVPHAMRKKQARQRPPKPQSGYRDRAAERRSNEQQEESTEDLLHAAEQDEALDAKQLYEKSKYLGGDVSHTHLVKGLDFSLLERVRNELNSKAAAAENSARSASASAEDAQEREDKGDQGEGEEGGSEDVQHGNEEINEVLRKLGQQEDVKVNSVMAKNIIHLFTPQPPNDLFMPGRMAFVFELADEADLYNDPFKLPTSVIRSKADMVRRRTDMQAETELVINKISNVMRHANKNNEIAAAAAAAKMQPKTRMETNREKEPFVAFDGDIFDDVGRDYELDESSVTNPQPASTATKANYFTGIAEEEKESEDIEMQEASDLLSKAIKREPEEPAEVSGSANAGASTTSTKRPRFEQPEIDVDAQDIDMYGLGMEALPTSFEERRRTVAYESGDEEDDNRTSLVDQGTHKNKKAQLTRWDFDDEEQWQKYKDSVEIHPKSAFQYGVKLGDGRKRNREQRKGMSDKQKLNREYQMVKNIMDKKYGVKPP
ncbi:RED-like protein N-terminal region-domain-containing protein [Dichotomocladium elegans]|nr:RED-like protein N-terminal region-domain-containing protein [Dichotomocladium elegans]